MRLIKATAFLQWIYILRYQDISENDFVSLSDALTLKLEIIFISHRWIIKEHPDPNSLQLEEIKKRIEFLNNNDNIVFFYDYCSMPQVPRTIEEDKIYKEDIENMDTVLMNCDKMIIISEGFSDYINRAWCFFEVVCGHTNIYLFEDQMIQKDVLMFTNGLPKLNEGIKNYKIEFINRSHFSWDNKDQYWLESMFGIFHHLNNCNITDNDDMWTIRKILVKQYHILAKFPLEKLLTNLHTYFIVSPYVISLEPVNLFKCKLYIDDKDWIRLPDSSEPNILEIIGGIQKQSILSIHNNDYQKLIEEKSAINLIVKLENFNLGDCEDFLEKFRKDKNWKKHLLPISDNLENLTIDQLMHTLLDIKSLSFTYITDPETNNKNLYLYFILH